MSTNYNVGNTFIKIVTTHKKNVWKILNKKFLFVQKKTLLKSNVLSAKKVNKKLATTKKKKVGSSKTVNMFLLGKG